VRATTPRSPFRELKPATRAASDSGAMPAALRERLLSLDVFRGLTIAGMLLVNAPGSWSHIYPPLEHASWHGWTPTDLIFPFFLFIVGITTHLSLSTRRQRGASEGELVRQILRRGGLIILLGLFLAAFPFFPADRLIHLRVPGVLQRIGVVYLAVALLSLRTTLKQQVAILLGLLIGYWFLMTLVPVPGEGAIGALLLDQPSRTLAAWTDRALLDGHLWSLSKTWDPEGPLSTVPAIGTGLLGLFAGRWLGSRLPLIDRIAGLFAAGAIGMMVGLMWSWVFPINKNLWTSTYVVFTGGMACVVLATCLWLIDEKHRTRWTKPFVVFGMNPIVAFVGSGMLARLIYSVIVVDFEGKRVPLQTAIYQAFYASWLSPLNASLLFAVSFVALWFGILTALYRRRIFLKV
jgi:predicted acyltransferase